MISAVTVAYTKFPDPHIENFTNSLNYMSKRVSELVVVYNKDEPFFKTEKVGKINIKHISPEPKNIQHVDKKTRRIYQYSKTIYQDHAFCLHKAIENAEEEYLLITDPDVVFYMHGFDEMYLNLYNAYDLNIIGISHYDNPVYGKDFPTVINCLIKKDKLPDSNWMKGELKLKPYNGKNILKYSDDWPCMDGHYLLPGPIKSRWREFPNPHTWFQTGCNLYLWDKDCGRKTVTFKCDEAGMTYNTTNVSFTAKEFQPLKKEQILMKHVKGFNMDKDKSLQMVKEWNKKAKSSLIKMI